MSFCETCGEERVKGQGIHLVKTARGCFRLPPWRCGCIGFTWIEVEGAWIVVPTDDPRAKAK